MQSQNIQKDLNLNVDGNHSFMNSGNFGYQHQDEKLANTAADVSFFFIHLKHKFIRLNLKDIRYIEAVAHHVKISTDQGMFIPHLSLKQLETVLPVSLFSRVNRGTIVAHDRIVAFDKDQIELKDIKFSFSDKYRKIMESKIKIMIHQDAKPAKKKRMSKNLNDAD